MIKISSAEIEKAYSKLRKTIMLPKMKLSDEIVRIWYKPEEAEIISKGFKTVLMDRYTVKKYASKFGIPEEKVQEIFDKVAKRGLLFYYYSLQDDAKKYYLPPIMPGLIEYYLVNKNNSIDERREFLKKFTTLEEEGLVGMSMDSNFSVFRIVPGTKPIPKERLIEVNENVEVDKSQVLAYQDVEKIIKDAGKIKNNIAILPCTCRTIAMMRKTSPECEAPVEVCMCIGAPARYTVEEGIGRYATVEEAIEILKLSEKHGLIHLTQNTYDKQGFICNCCSCCCGIIGTAIKMNNMNLFTNSDYIPVIDMETCKHCKKCIKMCSFHALSYIVGDSDDKSKDRILVRDSACIGCGVCASNCPTGSINLKKVRKSEPAKSFMEAAMKMLQGRNV